LAGSGRAALTAAVDRGLGLLLRPTGALSAATRRDWASLGLSLGGGGDLVPLRLDPAIPGTSPTQHDLPELGRLDATVTGTDAVAIVRDAEDNPLASWCARGRGLERNRAWRRP